MTGLFSVLALTMTHVKQEGPERGERLSIAILTYNHEQYIGRVLEGVLRQHVDFKYRVYINDDASTDNTVAIIQSYVARHPERLILFTNSENRGQMNGIRNFLSNAKGQYLTICDGDDYWTCPDKLQQQIDFLDAHPDYVASCHDAVIESSVGTDDRGAATHQSKRHFKLISQFTTYRGAEIAHWELLTGVTYMQNCTLVWRRFDLSPYMHLFTSVKFNLDWIFNVVVSMHGRVQYINEPWSVYTDHSSSRTKTNYFFNYYLDKISTLRQMLKLAHFKPSYNRRHLYVLLAKQYNDLMEGVSGGQKTPGMMFRFRVGYLYYSVLATIAHMRYFREHKGRLTEL